MRQLCARCLALGSESALVVTVDHFMACTRCGAIDEQATSVRNAAQVSTACGTLLHDDQRTSLCKEIRERQHERFVDFLLEIYLVNQATRIIHHDGRHFMAGARSWYNKMRAEEESGRQLKGMTTSNRAKKVPIRVALAILYTIQDSNITLVNSRLKQIKQGGASASTFRGDGSIMAPSIDALFVRCHLERADQQDRTEKLGSNNPGYIDNKLAVRAAHRHYCKAFDRKPAVVDILMAQILVMGRHIERLAKMDWAQRLTGLSFVELKAASQRKGITLETAGPDDFILDSAVWKYMSTVDWQKTLEAAFHLYSATCVVDLWGAKSSTNVASALLFWAITVAKQGEAVPQVTSWMSEMSQAFGGNDQNSMARRAELKDMMVAWSTSFPDIGVPIPLIAGPSRGKAVGDGLRGFGGDRKRAIPEYQMAGAAAPVFAERWRDIAAVRLATRTSAIPLDTEFCMAARMFAKWFAERHPTRRTGKPWAPPPPPKLVERKLPAAYQKTKRALEKARAKSRAGSKASSRATSERPPLESSPASPAPSSVEMSRTSSFGQASCSGSIASCRSSVGLSLSTASVSSRRPSSKAEMLQRMLAPSSQTTPPAPEPSIEELLAQHDDSSDDDGEGGRDANGETDVEWEYYPRLLERRRKKVARRPKTLPLDDVPNGPPFAFSIGPNGTFSVATDEPSSTPVVPVSRKRPASDAPAEPAKRSRVETGVPPTPPFTSSTVGRTPSPAPMGTGSSGPARPSPTVSTTPSLLEVSPSLPSVSMSPSMSQYSLPDKLPGESEESSYACLLRREREQYITYNVWNERRTGFAMPMEVEKAMDAWVADATAKGRLPATITKEYLASLGIYGDPRKQDLSPFIRDNPYGWSPTECLLRLGIKPREFPHHLLVYSLIGLYEELDGELDLAPIGDEINGEQLDAELDALFKRGSEPWHTLFVSDAEADEREKVYLKVGAWSYDRTVPEGPTNRLDGEQNTLEALQKRSRARRTSSPAFSSPALVPAINFPKGGSKRINYEALRRLADADDDEGAAEELALQSALGVVAREGKLAAESDEDDDDDVEYE